MSRQDVLGVLTPDVLKKCPGVLKLKNFQIFKNIKNIIIKILLNLYKKLKYFKKYKFIYKHNDKYN